MNNLIFIFKGILYLSAISSILIVLIVLIKKLCSSILAPKWHYYIWVLLLIRLMIPYSPESSISVFNLFYIVTENINLPVDEFRTLFQGNNTNEIDSTTGLMGNTNANGFYSDPTDSTTVTNNTNINSGNTEQGSNTNTTNLNQSNKDISNYYAFSIAALLWLLVVLLLSIYVIYINVSFSLKVHKNYVEVQDERLNGILLECKKRMKILRNISLLTSKAKRTPSLYTFFKPKILISENYMNQLSDDEIMYIFMHELSHYKRKDIIMNWVLTCLQVIYFFHPLVWYAIKRIHEDCEVACDEKALSYIKEEEYNQYGNTIIKLIKLVSESNFIPVTAGISKNKSSYRRRIIMISKYKKGRWTKSLLGFALILFIGSIGLTGCKQTEKNNTNQLQTSAGATDQTVTDNNTDPENIDSDNTVSGSDESNSTESNSIETSNDADNNGTESLSESSENQAGIDVSNPSEGTLGTSEPSGDSADEPKPAQSDTGNTNSSSTSEAVAGSADNSNPVSSDGTFASSSSQGYLGEWKISKVIAFGSVGTYSKEDAESLIGKSITFSSDKANYFGDSPSVMKESTSNPDYLETNLTSSDFTTNYRMTFDKLGITSDSITEVTVTNKDGFVSNFLVKDDNTLIISGGGTYFELTRK
ncbi:MAG: peptidase BlaR1 [Anaerocolumna sp.]|nr:peptidase BlaR1 [Anaerocolumna sp.]